MGIRIRRVGGIPSIHPLVVLFLSLQPAGIDGCMYCDVLMSAGMMDGWWVLLALLRKEVVSVSRGVLAGGR